MKKLKSLYKDLINGVSPKLVLVVFPLFTLLLFLTPMLFTLKSPFGFDFSYTGQIGDTIGGIVGPLIAVLAALLTFFAFWVQLKSNKAQTNQFQAQAKKDSVDRFETVFFELLKLHRDNVSDIILSELLYGRNAFIQLFYEYRFHYYALKGLPLVVSSCKSDIDQLSEQQCMDISYKVFFMGVEAGAYSVDKGFLSEYKKPMIMEYFKHLHALSNDFRIKSFASIKKYDDLSTTVSLKAPYMPFTGHQSTLGHYYRHLYQIVKYVDSVSEEINIDKYYYVKILRAQLSSHEQLMLFYYSLSSFGHPWLSELYISKYCMLKNLPMGLANFGVEPNELLGEKNQNNLYHFEQYK